MSPMFSGTLFGFLFNFAELSRIKKKIYVLIGRGSGKKDALLAHRIYFEIYVLNDYPF